MALELVGGALLGAVVGELVKAIIDLGERTINFNPVLKEIKSKLNSISPLIKQIEELNDSLDYPKEETENLRSLMKEGTQLLKSADAKSGKLDFFKRPSHTKKLRELDASIRSYMDVLLLQMARDQKKNLKMMTQLMEIIIRLDRKIGSSESENVELFVPQCLVPELREETFGLDEYVELLKMKFFTNEIKLLVVTAHGGSGKTTLALKFCHDKKVKDIFQEKIFFVSVSRKLDLMLILKNIIQSLKGIQVPDFENDERAFCYLDIWLKQTSQNPILIVLDDVWEGPESELLLDKLSQMSCCKILVTSRSVFPPRFSEPFYLEPLNHEDAMKLFLRSASLNVGKKKFPDEDIVKKIVAACKRLPLALKVIGRSLSGRPASVWKVTERKWSKGGSIFESDRELLECLQSSLDVLDDINKIIIKECFMDLGSFPEDQRIPASIFIDICAVLYDQDEDEAMSTLDELSSRSLINPVTIRNDASDEDYYNGYFFNQHDILRELAIHLMNMESIERRKRLILDIPRNILPKWWSQQEKQPINARLVSITTDETFSSCWHDMEAPEVEVLILNLRSRTYNLPGFIERMNKLRALIVTNYGPFRTELTSDYQLMNCATSIERIRLERIFVPTFGLQNLKPLENLQKISFFMCKVHQAFINSPTQISDSLPNLLEISIDFCNDLTALPDGICEIISLEKLNITNCHGLSSLPKELGELISLKTLRLRSCIHLEELPESVTKLGELVLLDISHCLCLTKLPEKINELQQLKKLDMRRCSSLDKLPLSVKKLKKLKIYCDPEIGQWLKMTAPHLANQVRVHEEEVNLDFLYL